MLKKILRINELILEETSQILLKEIEFPTNALVTVVKVDTSEDLKYSKIFVNILPSGQIDEAVMNILSSNAGRIQKMLIKKLNMHYVPRISFVLDKSGAEVDSLAEIFKKIENE